MSAKMSRHPSAELFNKIEQNIRLRFYRPLQAGRYRAHFVTKSPSKTQMSHLEAQDAKSVQNKRV